MKKKVTALITSLAMLIGFIAAVNAYVYPRVEGEKLEKRVNRVDTRVKESEKKYIKLNETVAKQINSIYMLLIKKK